MTATFVELQQRSLHHLEWARLESAVLSLCVSDSARRRGVRLADSHAATRDKLQRTAEIMSCLARGEPPPLQGLHDLDAHLRRLERGGTLDAPALVQLRSVLRAGRRLREFLSHRRGQCPSVYAACAIDPSLDQLEQLLDGTLRDDGSLEDHASPELEKLRTETANLRARIVARLEGLMERHRDLLQDDFYTLREGRYVLPIRSDAHERFAGIVHGSSQSGSSIFVEPRAIVEQGNRLKVAQADLEREEQRILGELSERASERLAEIEALCEAIDLVDWHQACAVLGQRLDGAVPQLRDDAALVLHGARHPLLALEGAKVVPNDLTLRAGAGLVISGPNAGGKSVLLKTLGLAALMVRAGMPIAASGASAVGYFDAVLSQMGDDQSTAHNLSTFSAHVRHVATILEHAGPRTLVLLDEPAAGTDPQEGAALACAIVNGILLHGAALATSTHYEALKAYSLDDARLECAAVGLDADGTQPTFRLVLGVPGRSSALSVARRFGLPAILIEHAESLVPEAAHRFERLLAELEGRLQQQHMTHDALEQELALQRAARTDLERKLSELKARGRAKVDETSAGLIAELSAARTELARQRTALKLSRDAADLREAEQQLNRVGQRVALGGDLNPPPNPQTQAGDSAAAARVEVGATVHVPRLNSEALIVEAAQRGKLRVAVGALKLWVGVDEVRPARVTGLQRGAPAPTLRAAPAVLPTFRSPDNTLDLRGLRIDDALPLLETFIDRMYGADQRAGFVLHGHGTGAMRDAVRKHLGHVSPQVDRHAPASHEDGGEAVTVFYLK